MNILQTVTEVIVDRFGVSEEKIQETSSFKDDLGADSLDIVELVMELEDRFDLEIPDEEAPKIQTVGDAVRYIEENK